MSGCSTDMLARMGYDVGQQYACMQSNDGRPYESNKDLKCMNPGEREGMSYDEYQAARSGE